MDTLIRAAAASHEPMVVGCDEDEDEDEDAPVVVDVLCEMVDRCGGSGGREWWYTLHAICEASFGFDEHSRRSACLRSGSWALTYALISPRLSLSSFRYVHSR